MTLAAIQCGAGTVSRRDPGANVFALTCEAALPGVRVLIRHQTGPGPAFAAPWSGRACARMS